MVAVGKAEHHRVGVQPHEAGRVDGDGLQRTHGVELSLGEQQLSVADEPPSIAAWGGVDDVGLVVGCLGRIAEAFGKHHAVGLDDETVLTFHLEQLAETVVELEVAAVGSLAPGGAYAEAPLSLKSVGADDKVGDSGVLMVADDGELVADAQLSVDVPLARCFEDIERVGVAVVVGKGEVDDGSIVTSIAGQSVDGGVFFGCCVLGVGCCVLGLGGWVLLVAGACEGEHEGGDGE